MKNKFFEDGCKALNSGRWEDAKKFLEEALKEEESPEIYEELSWACWWLNDLKSVFEYRSKAYNLFLEKNDKLGASRNASWTGLDYIELKGEYAIASGWFQRAENLLEGTEPSRELALIKMLKGRFIFSSEKNFEAALKLINEALEISKSLKIPEVEMIGEAFKGFIMVIEGKISEGMPLLDDAALLATTDEKNDPYLSTVSCCFLIDACERIRDYERAGQWCNKVKEICKRWRYEAMFANCRMKHAGVLIWKGDWKEAEEELLAAVNELNSFRPAQAGGCLIRLGDLKRRQGKWNEAEKLFNQVKSHSLKLFFSAALVFDKEDYENSLSMAERYFRQFSTNEKTERIVGLELLVRIYLKLGNLEKAKLYLDELNETAKMINTLPLKAASLSAQGIFNYTIKNYDLARENLEDAADIYDKIICPFESSRTRLILAEVLIKLNRFAQAESELNAAMEISKKLGAEKDFEKAKNMLKSMYQDNAEQINKNIYEFTGRELEILKLIAEGKNNEEIAKKLFLSVRTVEKHITNIYSKMGISGKSARAYAASFAIKHKLIFI